MAREVKIASFLLARPVAHRGLHDDALGIAENSLSALDAAVAAGYAVECDARLAADGEAMVFHDEALGRLTTEGGALNARTARDLSAIALRGGADRIPSLPVFLKALAGRIPLVVEIKSFFDGDMRLARRVAALTRAYDGCIALKSFDSGIIQELFARRTALGLEKIPLGIVGESRYDNEDWAFLSHTCKAVLTRKTYLEKIQPDFFSWRFEDLSDPSLRDFCARREIPLLTWTIRDAAQQKLALSRADQIIFEGFAPSGSSHDIG